MRCVQIAHLCLTCVSLIICLVGSGMVATGAVHVHWNVSEEHSSCFFEEKDAPRLANPRYPEWFRGKGADGKADKAAKYSYTQIVGPKGPGLHAKGLLFGTLVLKAGATYPAHRHPASEIYFILEGEADWYVNGEKYHVKPGTTVMHRRNANHGWKNTSKEKDLKAIWVWWAEGDRIPEDLKKRAVLSEPGIANSERTALPYMRSLFKETKR